MTIDSLISIVLQAPSQPGMDLAENPFLTELKMMLSTLEEPLEDTIIGLTVFLELLIFIKIITV